MIDITGLDKGEVLAALYNSAQQQGLGLLNERGKRGLSVPEAQEMLCACAEYDSTRLYFDYVHGRVLKVVLAGDYFDPTWYDRDNGAGRAEEVVDKLRVAIAKRKGECA